MKRLIIALLFVAITFASYSQSAWKGFFRPIPRGIYEPIETTDRGYRVDESTSFWLFRPTFQLTALQFNFVNPITVSSLSSLGTGLSYQHFVNANGEPYNNYGFNALILFSENIGGVEPAKLSFALTGNFLQYVSIGVGYSTSNKTFFALTGVVIHFNQ
jgi:hypothetical protein